MSAIWQACREAAAPTRLQGRLVRIVESQEQVATTTLVDDLAEQALLEALVERSKPPLAPGTEGLHYLLATPFRYPPLRHGSRFGGRHEPALFYAARRIETALAEAAYYRLLFWDGMVVAPPEGRLLTQHTAFTANYRTAAGLRLQQPPFARFEPELRDPSDYRATQALGGALRAAGIAAIEYRSAREQPPGLNVALFTPAALASRKPLTQQPWLCETTAAEIRFSTPAEPGYRRLPRTDFLVDGRLPQPAP